MATPDSPSAPAAPNVLVRADASSLIGSGHVMRCLSLAAGLRSRGANVTFVMSQCPNGLRDRVSDAGFPIVMIAPPRLGEAQDAEATKNLLGLSHDWVIVDHYGLGRVWETAMRGAHTRILSIDDLADRPHDCDVLLDQNLVADMEKRYDGLTGRSTHRLLGPKYALLGETYRKQRAEFDRPIGPVRRVLTYFGAADTCLTTRVLEAFRALHRGDVKLDIVLDPLNVQRPNLDRLVGGAENIQIVDQLPDLAAALARADLFVGASGTTSWERLCLGLRSIVVTLAANQRPVAAELARRGLITLLGDSETVDTPMIARALSEQLSCESSADQISAMMQQVDGVGVDRVCEAITLPVGATLRLRKAVASDSDLTLSWANDPGTRRYAFNRREISPQEHEVWFAARLDNDAVAFFIAETPYGIPVGQVRFERQDDCWEISYLLSPLFRGRKLGQALLEAALVRLGAAHPDVAVRGRVLTDNEASIRIFRALDFRIDLTPNDGQHIIFHSRTSAGQSRDSFPPRLGASSGLGDD